MENKNVFITGATGFIGKNLALKLAEKNRVFALVRRESIKKTIILQEKGIEIILGDLLNSNSYSRKLNDIDYVFHLAALCKLDAPKELLYKYNVLGAERLLESCRDRNIQKIIHFSTAYVSGTKEKDFITEEEPYPKKFKNRYEWSKAMSEKIVLDFYKKYSLPIVIVRPAIVYGAGSIWGFYDALSLISKGKLWITPGNGKNKVHLVHVDDVVAATIHLAEKKEIIGEIYHICDDKPYTCNELIKVTCHQLNIRPPLISLPHSIIRFISRLPIIWKLFFRGTSKELLDYFLYNQTYANIKLKSTGFLFGYPSPTEGLISTINWYYENNLLTKS